MMKILVIHGPNIHLLGKISAKTGTRLTLDKLNTFLRREARDKGIELKIYHFFDEKNIYKCVNSNRNNTDYLLFSPGGLANNCYSLRELLSIINIPVAEVHLTEFPFSKENFSNSIIKDLSSIRIIDQAQEAYRKAVTEISLIKTK